MTPVRVVVAALASAGTALLLGGPLVLRIAAGALVYGAVLASLRALPLADLAILRQSPLDGSGGKSTMSIQ